jgi:glutathione S-transferase
MSAPLKLISHKLCPYVQRAVIALNEKGVPFERVDIDLANKPDWFLKISPLGKVPVLVMRSEVDDEVALFESNVICEYIEDTQGGARLHPQVPCCGRSTGHGWNSARRFSASYGVLRPPAIPRSLRASASRWPQNLPVSNKPWVRVRSSPAKSSA